MHLSLFQTKVPTPNKDVEQEKKLLQDAAKSKEAEQESILDLYRKGVIGSKDVEIQFKKIDEERQALLSQVTALENEIDTEKELQDRRNSAEALLRELQTKIHQDLSFEEKRQVVKTLVEQITIHSSHDGNRRRPKAEVSIQYTFDSKVVTRTDVRADNNRGIGITKTEQLQPDIRTFVPRQSGDTRGGRLYSLRMARGLTMQALADKAGLSVITISNIERKRKHLGSLDTLKVLAKVLNTTIEHLGCFDLLPDKTLGQRITKQRLARGWTKKQLAQQLGVNEKTIRLWEDGRCSPSPDNSKKLKDLGLI